MRGKHCVTSQNGCGSSLQNKHKFLRVLGEQRWMRRVSRSSRFCLCTPKIRKKVRLFCRLLRKRLQACGPRLGRKKKRLGWSSDSKNSHSTKHMIKNYVANSKESLCPLSFFSLHHQHYISLFWNCTWKNPLEWRSNITTQEFPVSLNMLLLVPQQESFWPQLWWQSKIASKFGVIQRGLLESWYLFHQE